MEVGNHSDEVYMRVALEEARSAYAEGEVPIGAVVVCNGKIIGRAHNRVEALQDVTAHAELLAITSASEYLGSKFLSDCSLYVTVEPCTMCATAIGWARVRRLVYGCSEVKYGYSHLAGEQVLHRSCEVSRELLADECASLMQSFFRSRR